MEDLISIVVPVYNVEKYLEYCLNSIMGQTYTNIEIILVDDGSKDRSGDICDEYVKRDKRIKCVHKKNAGLGAARNTGIDIATGKYISFIDSDDEIEYNMIEILYHALKKYKVSVARCGLASVYKLGNLQPMGVDENKCSYRVLSGIDYLLEYQNPSANCALFLTEIFRKYHFVEGKLCEDAYTISRILSEIDKLVYVGKRRLYHYYIRNGSIIQSFKDKGVSVDMAWVMNENLKFYKKRFQMDKQKFYEMQKYQIEFCLRNLLITKRVSKDFMRLYRKCIISNMISIYKNNYIGKEMKKSIIYIFLLPSVAIGAVRWEILKEESKKIRKNMKRGNLI